MKKIRILLADDHNIMRRGLRLLLERQPGFEVVAEASNLSPYTVETHRRNLQDKLNLHSVAELILYAVRKGIIS